MGYRRLTAARNVEMRIRLKIGAQQAFRGLRKASTQQKGIITISFYLGDCGRDLFVLKGRCRAEKICPVDMFPCTGHVETVVLMSKST